MYPSQEVDLRADLPDSVRFDVPKPSELNGEEGIGWFRDTWVLGPIGVRAARSVVERDRELCEIVAALSKNADDFDRIARQVEGGDLDTAVLEPNEMAAIENIADGVSLDGLELGIAGLVYALSAAGAITAASCRGHRKRAWSDVPVVYFTTDEPRARAISALVRASGCGYLLDPNRPDLICVAAKSVEQTLELAYLVSANLTQLRAMPKSSRRKPLKRALPSPIEPLF